MSNKTPFQIKQENFKKSFAGSFDIGDVYDPNEFSKGHPVGYVNKYGKMKMPDGSWQYKKKGSGANKEKKTPFSDAQKKKEKQAAFDKKTLEEYALPGSQVAEEMAKEKAKEKAKKDPLYGKRSEAKAHWKSMDPGVKSIVLDQGGFSPKFIDSKFSDLTPAVQEHVLKDMKAESAKRIGKKLSVKADEYVVKIENGNSWKAILHPKDVEAIKKIHRGIQGKSDRYSFKDEQGKYWIVTPGATGELNIEGQGYSAGKKGHFRKDLIKLKVNNSGGFTKEQLKWHEENAKLSKADEALALLGIGDAAEHFEKGHPVGYINKYGKQKQSDGSWKYVAKGGKGPGVAKSDTDIPKASGIKVSDNSAGTMSVKEAFQEHDTSFTKGHFTPGYENALKDMTIPARIRALRDAEGFVQNDILKVKNYQKFPGQHEKLLSKIEGWREKYIPNSTVSFGKNNLRTNYKGDLFVNGQKVQVDKDSGFVKLGGGGNQSSVGGMYSAGHFDGQLQGNSHVWTARALTDAVAEGKSQKEIEKIMTNRKSGHHDVSGAAYWEMLKDHLKI